jgi:hypothetical protein
VESRGAVFAITDGVNADNQRGRLIPPILDLDLFHSSFIPEETPTHPVPVNPDCFVPFPMIVFVRFDTNPCPL